MWRKVTEKQGLTAQSLFIVSQIKVPNAPISMVTWETDDGIVHLRSMDNLQDIPTDDDTRFFLWQEED